jgi:hypothetical protein
METEIASFYQSLLSWLLKPQTEDPPITAEALEQHYHSCKVEIASIQSELTSAINTILTDVAKLQTDMAALQDFALKLYELTVGKINPPSIAHSHQNLSTSTPGTATSQPQP